MNKIEKTIREDMDIIAQVSGSRPVLELRTTISGETEYRYIQHDGRISPLVLWCVEEYGCVINRIHSFHDGSVEVCFIVGKKR